METPQTAFQEPLADVMELCTIMQCLGFSVKSLETSGIDSSQEAGVKTVVINCQPQDVHCWTEPPPMDSYNDRFCTACIQGIPANFTRMGGLSTFILPIQQSSGLHVVLESGNANCSCPIADFHTSGLWQVSGIAGGKQIDKKTGSTLLGSLPNEYREHVARQLREIVKVIKENNDADCEGPRKERLSKSVSTGDLTTAETSYLQVKVDSPPQYHSLDTLTSAKEECALLPAPGVLQKPALNVSAEEDAEKKGSRMCRRASTYIISSFPAIVPRSRNKTSSPIQDLPSSSILESLIAAEKKAEELREQLSMVIKEMGGADDGTNDLSMSSLALDVSKISHLKGVEGKSQFASSPNLSVVASTKESSTLSRPKRLETVSTSNLNPKKMAQEKEGKMAKLKRRLSPNLFRMKESPGVKDRTQDGKNKLNADFKPRMLTPVQTPKENRKPSPNLSSCSRKNFSHIKSTIPRLASVKKE